MSMLSVSWKRSLMCSSRCAPASNSVNGEKREARPYRSGFVLSGAGAGRNICIGERLPEVTSSSPRSCALSRLLMVACAALVLAACVRPETISPATKPVDLSASREPQAPPDVAGARAEKEAALRDIEASLPPGEARTHLMNVLTGKGTPGTVSYFDSPNPEMNARFQRFYAAHVHLANELRR